MNIDFTPSAWGEYVDWLQEDKKTIKRINLLIKDIMRIPFDGVGKPEALRGNLSGFWSRRIDDRHRLVYQVLEDRCLIVQCQGHYTDT